MLLSRNALSASAPDCILPFKGQLKVPLYPMKPLYYSSPANLASYCSYSLD